MFTRKTIFSIGLVIVMLFPVLSLAQTVDLPQTGQTTCYDAAGTPIACAMTGQDGDILAGVGWPVTRFTDNADGTVTDSLTGLIWLKDANCYGTRTWSQALTDANGLSTGSCGLSDGSSAGNWRLPNINELESLVNAEVADIGAWLISEGFVNVLTDYYWSSSNYMVLKTQALMLTYSDGRSAISDKGSTYNVWPVRGTTTTPAEIWQTGQTICYDATGAVVTCAGTGQDGELQEGATWPVPRFNLVYCDGTGECLSQASDCDAIASTDVVIDNLTGLMLARDANLPSGNDTWANTLTYANGLSLCGHDDWYLPNRKEMHSLTDFSNVTPALPSGHPFINVINSRYWTSTTSASLKDRAFGYNTSTGIINPYTKGTSYYVWPVRQPIITYSISGTVTSGGPGLSGVTMTLSGAGSGTTTTDGSGNYTFPNLPNGAYTVTPSMAGYTFAPPNAPVVINNADMPGIDFVGTPITYSISGTVTSGGALPGVTMTLSGAGSGTTLTDGAGNYTFPNLPNGVYTVTPSMAGYTFAPPNTVVTISGANMPGINFVGTATLFSISGTVTSGGPGLSGVTMTLSGAGSAVTTTDGSGNYTFPNLPNGSYTVTPSMTGYTFAPTSSPVVISGANMPGINFVGTPIPTYSISGVVWDGGVVGLAGVTVTLSGAGSATTTTDVSGYYVFPNLANGGYTVTPSMAGYVMSPVNRAVTISGASVTGQDFNAYTASSVHSISGVVWDGGVVGLAGVTVTLSGAGSGTTTTDANGYYVFPNLPDGGYTVTPSMAGYVMSPVDRAVTLSGADVTGQDFNAYTAPTLHSISGTVTSGGSGLAGVTVTLSGAGSGTTTTDGSGNYTFPNLADGGYTVTPSMAGYVMSPVDRAVTLSGADVTGQDFTASTAPTLHSISGVVWDGGIVGLGGVTVTLSGAGSGTTTTDAHGYYIFSNLADGGYTVTPSMAGYVMSPVDRAVTLSGADVTGQDFAAIIPPLPDIMANGSDGPILLGPYDPLSITVNFEPGSYAGMNGDWWVAVDTPYGWWYYSYPTGWYPIGDLSFILPTHQGPFGEVSTVEILNTTLETPGPYIFYFGVDTIMNGVIDWEYLYYDAVVVNIL